MPTKKAASFVESSTFLICELIFCIAFISMCEVPNWMKGPYSHNQCVDRWMFAAGLFIPSGIQGEVSGPILRTKSTKTSPHTDPDKIG